MPDSLSAEMAVATSEPSRLRLKRVFLQTLIWSLTICGVVAVVALLLGQFSDTTARILLTLGGLALHSGVALACATALERGRWPRLNVVGLVLFGLNFIVLTTCIWWGPRLDEPAGKALVTTGALLGYYLLAIPGADLAERRQWRPLPLVGLAACVVGFLMLLVCIWAEPTEDLLPKAAAVAAIVAFSLTHTCLLLHVPGGTMIGWLFRGTLAALWALAGLAALMILAELEDEFLFRLLGALGVVDACGSLTLLIMAKLKKVGRAAQLQTVAAQIELRCPRCTQLQVFEPGDEYCTHCGLRIRIEIEEPRCAKCDYLLWQLPNRRCPECGTAF